jgi:diacylglycerol kinase (ATP)
VRTRAIVFSFNYAIQGVAYALRTQWNMRLHVIVAALVMAAALFFRLGTFEVIALAFAITLVFVTELVNTALEAAVDIATDSFEPLAKTAKDVAAGAVLVAAINAVVVGYLVFLDPLSGAVETVFERVRSAPAHLTVIALALTMIAVVVTKALNREGSFMSGGWPSGHAALAFAAATALAFVTESARATLLALFIAFLVAQSRVEGDFHSVTQTVIGALLGVLLATAVFQLFSW